MQSQHRYSEVNTLLARAEQRDQRVMDGTLHAEFNALRAGSPSTTAIRKRLSGWRNWRWMSFLSHGFIAVLSRPPFTVKCCTVKAISASLYR